MHISVYTARSVSSGLFSMRKLYATLLAMGACLFPGFSLASDNNLYIGMGVLYMAHLNNYTSQWIGDKKSWTQDIDVRLNYGSGEYLEAGSARCNGKMSIGVSLIHASLQTGTSQAWLSNQANSVLGTFEYVLKHEEPVGFYFGAGLGASHISNKGEYLREIISNPVPNSIQFANGKFDNTSEIVLAYNFKAGIRLSGNMPMMVRIGYQFFGTTNLQNTLDIGSVQTTTTVYQNNPLAPPPQRGNSTMYSEPHSSALNISAIQFKINIFEIGVVFVFAE